MIYEIWTRFGVVLHLSNGERVPASVCRQTICECFLVRIRIDTIWRYTFNSQNEIIAISHWIVCRMPNPSFTYCCQWFIHHTYCVCIMCMQNYFYKWLRLITQHNRPLHSFSQIFRCDSKLTYSLRRHCTHAHLLQQNRNCIVSVVCQRCHCHWLPHVRHAVVIHVPLESIACCRSCRVSNRHPNHNHSNATTAPTYPDDSNSYMDGASAKKMWLVNRRLNWIRKWSHILILIMQWIVSNASILVFHQIEIWIEYGLWQWHINVFTASIVQSIAVCMAKVTHTTKMEKINKERNLLRKLVWKLLGCAKSSARKLFPKLFPLRRGHWLIADDKIC